MSGGGGWRRWRWRWRRQRRRRVVGDLLFGLQLVVLDRCDRGDQLLLLHLPLVLDLVERLPRLCRKRSQSRPAAPQAAGGQRWAESWGSPRHAALAMHVSLQGAGWRRVSRLAPDRVPCLLEVAAADERTHGVRDATQRPHARQIEVREDCLLHLGRKVLQHLSLRHRRAGRVGERVARAEAPTGRAEG